MTVKRYFAVGLKKWTQIRVAAKPPKGTTSEVVTIAKKRRLRWVQALEGGWGGYKDELVPTKLKLKSTIYTGGRVIDTVKSAYFSRLLKVAVRDGGLLELMPEQMAQLEAAKGVKSDKAEQ